jgi:virginiamycin A acetyltransferase
MPFSLPDPATRHPIILPGGQPHEGTVFLRAMIDHPRIEVGDYTYASTFDAPRDWASQLAPYLFPFSVETLRIGKFCQIAHGVRFITSSANHEARGPSTFPFAIFDSGSTPQDQPDIRDTVIGHDVWLGFEATVLPGTTIGNGAIIGAGAVIGGTVPDYAVVTGNPGRVRRMRFDDLEIAQMNRLAWWDWPPDHIAAARPILQAGKVRALAAYAQDNGLKD